MTWQLLSWHVQRFVGMWWPAWLLDIARRSFHRVWIASKKLVKQASSLSERQTKRGWWWWWWWWWWWGGGWGVSTGVFSYGVQTLRESRPPKTSPPPPPTNQPTNQPNKQGVILNYSWVSTPFPLNSVNSLRPGGEYISCIYIYVRHRTRSSLVRVMACRLFADKPLVAWINDDLNHYQMGP